MTYSDALDAPGPGAAPSRPVRSGGAVVRWFSERPFFAVLAIVAVLAGIYYAFIAAPQYVSETRFAIRSKEAAAPTTILQGLTGQSEGLSEITAVSDYIRSRDMLRELDRRHGLRAEYSARRADVFRRLPAGASEEDFLRFYRRMVIVRLDREADIVTVEVRAFRPETAQAAANSILELTETFTDGLSARLRQESSTSARSELALAERQLQQARSAVAGFRTASDDVNPSATGAQASGGVGALETQITAARGELASLLTYSQPNSPQVRQVQARIAVLNSQIAALRARQGQEGGGNLSQRVSQFEALIAQRDLAERRYASALSAFDTARTAAEQREKFVVRIVQPNRPDEPTEPRRFLDWLMIIIFAVAGYTIATLIVAGIRDHQGI